MDQLHGPLWAVVWLCARVPETYHQSLCALSSQNFKQNFDYRLETPERWDKLG